MARILFIDGGLHGKRGNTAQFVNRFLTLLPKHVEIDYLELASCPDIAAEQERFQQADGFIFASGTYWQSWSHHAQRFFEQATYWEGTGIFLGKPVCTIITMHSIGGAEVLSRAQNNFNLLGCLIPPMCCIAYSMVNQIATEHSDNLDIWNEDSFPSIAHNLMAAIEHPNPYQTWDVASVEDTYAVWVKDENKS